MTVPREAGAIHDIGYRRYDGPRLGATYAERSLALSSLRGAFGLGRSTKSKVMPMILAAVMVIPAFIVVAVVIIGGADELPLEYPSYAIRLSVISSVFLASQSPAVMSRDLRFRVVALYFSRPLSRRQYVQAKYAGMALALFLLIGLPVTLLLAGALLAELPIDEQLPDYLRAMAGAALYAVVLAGIGLLVAAMTPRRGLGVAAVVGVLLVLSGLQATVMAMADEFGNDTFTGYTGLVSPYTLVDGVVTGVLGADPSVGDGPPGALGTVLFVAVAALIVAGCYAGLVARYRKALS